MGMLINSYAFGGFTNSHSNDMDGVDEFALCSDSSLHSFGNGGTDSPMTVMVAMKRDAIGVNSCLLSKHVDSQQEWYLAILGNSLRFVIRNLTGNNQIGRSAPMATVGSWIWIAATYDASKTVGGIDLFSITTAGVVSTIDNANVINGTYTGMSNSTSGVRIGAINTGGVNTWNFNGLLFLPMIVSKVMSNSELQEVALNPYKDPRTYSFSANVVSAWHFPSGDASYPTWTDCVNGINATMQNAESGDINTDVP